MYVRKGKRFTVKKSDKLCFSKKLVIFFAGVYLEIVAYTQIAMWHFRNITALEYLLVNVVPPVITVIGYFVKASKENCKGGIVYDAAMQSIGEEDT